jgi:hypothetical protein
MLDRYEYTKATELTELLWMNDDYFHLEIDDPSGTEGDV